ncbi:hypothetical protein BDFB_014304 [Asbolus verrucosus]|uniref:Uncharacterized protein n=1 Tax=Asbolus verrucosus TaxID=1661398 RepID=A0A482V8W0_ASBVE|nr:hypothetical protein BDFB_014304 [Asbolus verrucosus]
MQELQVRNFRGRRGVRIDGTNLICQSGLTAACLHFVLLCGRDPSEAAALAESGGRRHPRRQVDPEHFEQPTPHLRHTAPHFRRIYPLARRFLFRSAPVLSGLEVFGTDRLFPNTRMRPVSAQRLILAWRCPAP